MKTSSVSANQLIAPCGINCGVCFGFLREKNKCGGCCGDDDKKPKYCLTCKIKNCELLAKTDSKFCYDCETYPCTRLKQLEKRYRTRYNMSIFENFSIIKQSGLDVFVQLEKEKWKCSNCGDIICIHRGFCIKCGKS